MLKKWWGVRGYGWGCLAVVFISVYIWFDYEQAIVQSDFMDEISLVPQKSIQTIILKEGRDPYRVTPCVKITDDLDMQFIVDSLQNVSNEIKTPFQNTIDVEFQLSLFYVDYPSTEIIGIGFEQYPMDLYIERNLWTKIKGKQYRPGQKALYWPDMGPWIKEKLKEADLANCEEATTAALK